MCRATAVLAADLGAHRRDAAFRRLDVSAPADVTIERITSLVATGGTDPLAVDFTKNATPRLAECAASTANAHGRRLIFGRRAPVAHTQLTSSNFGSQARVTLAVRYTVPWPGVRYAGCMRYGQGGVLRGLSGPGGSVRGSLRRS